ncbi:ABC transporter ATP-binding protein [Trinickia sp. NRRL B-1857]|uniref:ABC transporter ATP-binding protein n=1 Tax=Trinickia sp. NRRL B-1857 TaxID=3162879 RepID=UPI003D2691D4
MPDRHRIEVINVSYARGSRDILRDVDLAVEPGKLVAMVGLNGAGKTTLISLLATLAVPRQGRIVVNGIDAAREPSKVRASIGVVFQASALEPRLSARENLWFIARCQGLRGRAARQRVDELLASLSLGEQAATCVGSLSGGQRRRLELARALVARPQVLLLDEPTIGLDVAARQAFWAEIKTLADTGHTILCSTHHTDEARDADSVVVLDRGRVLAHASWRSLCGSVAGAVRLQTPHAREASRWLSEHGYSAQCEGDAVAVACADPQAVLPALLRQIPYAVDVVRIATPDLHDVLQHCIGRHDEEAIATRELTTA